jgi:hypothetical protein
MEREVIEEVLRLNNLLSRLEASLIIYGDPLDRLKEKISKHEYIEVEGVSIKSCDLFKILPHSDLKEQIEQIKKELAEL